MQTAIRSIRRRNALVPLPLLPPVPCNTIVTSVRIVHNQSDSNTFDNAPQFTSPFSPSPTNLCFAPVTGCGAKRVRSARRRSSCTPCQQPTVQKSNSVAVPNDNCDSSLLNPNRKPRSTIVVTVRLANPAPTNASYGSRSPQLIPAPRAAAAGVTGAFAAMQARKVAHKPRVSSPLASSVVTAGAPSGTCSPIYVDAAAAVRPVAPVVESARRYARKSKSNKGKNVGRVGMLRWAVLNNSGPEVGRRILAMGPKLAQEIWEAERVVEKMEAVESNEMEVVEKKQDVEVPAGQTEEHNSNNNAREKLVEECIRELEEMEVDSEDIEMESSSSTLEAITTTEKATETPKSENNNNNMDVDMPAPGAVVTPLSTARQVQIQLEIAVEVFSSAKKAQKDAEKSKRWFERIAL